MGIQLSSLEVNSDCIELKEICSKNKSSPEAKHHPIEHIEQEIFENKLQPIVDVLKKNKFISSDNDDLSMKQLLWDHYQLHSGSRKHWFNIKLKHKNLYKIQFKICQRNSQGNSLQRDDPQQFLNDQRSDTIGLDEIPAGFTCFNDETEIFTKLILKEDIIDHQKSVYVCNRKKMNILDTSCKIKNINFVNPLVYPDCNEVVLDTLGLQLPEIITQNYPNYYYKLKIIQQPRLLDLRNNEDADDFKWFFTIYSMQYKRWLEEQTQYGSYCHINTSLKEYNLIYPQFNNSESNAYFGQHISIESCGMKVLGSNVACISIEEGYHASEMSEDSDDYHIISLSNNIINTMINIGLSKYDSNLFEELFDNYWINKVLDKNMDTKLNQLSVWNRELRTLKIGYEDIHSWLYFFNKDLFNYMLSFLYMKKTYA